MRIPLTHPVVSVAQGERALLQGLWRLADPKIALASLVPFCAGAAMAWREQHAFSFGIAAAAFVAIFCVEVGKNAVNDLYDFRSGADPAVQPEERSPYSGGKRVLLDHLLTERDLVVIACTTFALAAVIGTAVAMVTVPALLLFGAAAALVSILYVWPPVKLAYRGLGELAVFAVYGPGIVLGTVLLFGGTLTAEAVSVSIILGILIAAVLLTNELPDARADGAAGKRTLIVRMGRDLGTAFVGVLFAVAFGTALMLVAYRGTVWIAGTLVGIPFSYVAYVLLRRDFDRPPIAGQTATLITYAVTGLGLAIGAIVL
jgi:1,4-dihydroxy-2-naphthoate octaprenyltransferase